MITNLVKLFIFQLLTMKSFGQLKLDTSMEGSVLTLTLREPIAGLAGMDHFVESSDDLVDWKASSVSFHSATIVEEETHYKWTLDSSAIDTKFFRVRSIPTLDIVMVGDSLTAGVNGPNNNIPKFLEALTGRSVTRLGYSGQGTPFILANWQAANTHHNKIAIFWPGNNDGQMAAYTPNLPLFVDELTTVHPRFLFIDTPNRAIWD